ncbi:hypothetical protein FGO68_gene15420 [Halteria grandinella]|uniref:Uncharacterized protein n=1 Tax=Halteria grandinella TaxID=5974 RepID=A0A8J8NYZ5_HALGN|nr:hypothetical protein FGO68_gene15420 [Halteria grandinella]
MRTSRFIERKCQALLRRSAHSIERETLKQKNSLRNKVVDNWIVRLPWPYHNVISLGRITWKLVLKRSPLQLDEGEKRGMQNRRRRQVAQI